MTTCQPLLVTLSSAPDYIKGVRVVDELQTATNSESYKHLGERLNVPSSTISAWSTHERTPFEVLIRVHLITKSPMARLALGVGEEYSTDDERLWWHDKSIDLPPFNYLSGKEAIERLKIATKCKTMAELSNKTNVARGTFNTWIKHERTPFELIIRVHLFTGIPVKQLILVDEDYASKVDPQMKSNVVASETNTPPAFLSIQRFQLSSIGTLVLKDPLIFDRLFLSDIAVCSPMVVTTQDSTVIIDKEINQAVSGTYLVDMDGLLSLNDIQRLPGKQLAISFAGSVLTVDELSVKIVGKVVLDLRKG